MKKRILITLACSSLLCLTTLLAEDDKRVPADNTGKNERDRSGETLTSGDQSNNPEDMKVTAAIRQAIMKDSSLSLDAHNIKIITADSRVTLRGPVNTVQEKTKIGQLAQSAAKNAKIDNQLEIKEKQN